MRTRPACLIAVVVSLVLLVAPISGAGARAHDRVRAAAPAPCVGIALNLVVYNLCIPL